MSDFDTATWPSDRTVLTMVTRAELEWGSHEKAVSRVARQLDMRPVAVMEACDRAINGPEGMLA